MASRGTPWPFCGPGSGFYGPLASATGHRSNFGIRSLLPCSAETLRCSTYNAKAAGVQQLCCFGCMPGGCLRSLSTRLHPSCTQSKIWSATTDPKLLEHTEPLALHTQRHVELAPEVLQRHCRCQLDQLWFREVAAEALPQLVADTLAGDRHLLGVLERRALHWSEQLAVAPGRHLTDLLVARARVHPPGCIDVDSERAAVDEGDAQVHEREQRRFELTGALDRRRELLGGAQDGRTVGEDLGRVQQAAEQLALLGE